MYLVPSTFIHEMTITHPGTMLQACGSASLEQRLPLDVQHRAEALSLWGRIPLQMRLPALPQQSCMWALRVPMAGQHSM